MYLFPRLVPVPKVPYLEVVRARNGDKVRLQASVGEHAQGHHLSANVNCQGS